MLYLVFLVSISALLGLIIIILYNTMVRKNNYVKEAWAGIDVQLKMRYDLIPSLVEIVKAYAKHEKTTLAKVVELRNEAHKSSSIEDKATKEENLSTMLKSIFVLAEDYPELKANTNFIELQGALTDIEDNLQMARRYYNASVRDFNTLIEIFPVNLLAPRFNFTEKEFFTASESERQNVEINL